MTTANNPSPAPEPAGGLVLQRTFAAPRELVFQTWTDPAHLIKWWGPRGFSVPKADVDPRPGGRFNVDMQGEDGVVMPGSGRYEEIARYDRLVLVTEAFPDARGEPMLQVRHTVTFEEAGPASTLLTLRATVLRSTPEVYESLKWMKVGWETSLDKLEAALAAFETVTSRDGTRIAFDAYGSGPALILISGALGYRANGAGHDLATRLAGDFRVINYDRRGRGDSGDTPPYAVEREIEDIEALIDYAGGSAYLYGMSSGAALALEAANALGSKVKKLVMYEPPYVVDDTRPPVPADYVEQINAAVADGRRGDAVEIFMIKAVGVPAEFVQMMRHGPPAPAQNGQVTPPAWAQMEAVAHTLAYDGAIMGSKMRGQPLPSGLWPAVSAETLIVTGGASAPFFAAGAQAAVAQLPKARHQVLEGQDHAVSPEALAPLLIAFFTA